MLNVSIKNICDGYMVYLDDCLVDLRFQGTTASFSKEISAGEHRIRIVKKQQKIAFRSVIYYWLSALFATYDRMTAALFRCPQNIEMIYKINLSSNESVFVFDSYTNSVVKSSDSYLLEYQNIEINKAEKRKLFFAIKAPLFLLVFVVLTPLWILTFIGSIKTSEPPAIIAFSFLTILLIMSIIAMIRSKKNKW